MASPINRDYWDHQQVASATIIYTHSTDSPSTSITNRYRAERGSNTLEPKLCPFSAAIAALQVTMSVCWSVVNRFYRRVMQLLVYLCCFYYCSLDYQNILLVYFTFLAAIAALQVTMSVLNKLDTSYNVFMRRLVAYIRRSCMSGRIYRQVLYVCRSVINFF